MSSFAGLWGASAGVRRGIAGAGAGAVVFGGILFLSGFFDRPDDVVIAVPEPATLAPAEPVTTTEPEPVAPEPVAKAEPEPEPEPAAPEAVATAEPEPTAPAPVALAEPEPERVAPEAVASAEPDPVAPQPEAAPAQIDAPDVAAAPETIAPGADVPAPRFDLVRVEPDGTTLIAGTGAPDSEIVIVMDGTEFGRATSDASGAFVSFLWLPQSSDARVLSLVSRHANGDVLSEEQVIIAPSPTVVADAAAAEEAPSVGEAPPEDVTKPDTIAQASTLESDTTPEPAAVTSEIAQTATLSTPELPDAGQKLVPDPQETVAIADVKPEESTPLVPSENVAAPIEAPKPVTVFRADADGVEVLQSARSDAAPEVTTSVALDAISYSDIGDVRLSGRAPDQGAVRVYLDNAPIATLDVDDTGHWRGDLPEVETGVYTLRIDQLDDSGAVTSRVETPFKREEPEVLTAALEQAGNANAPVSAVTVQKGATLWAIARDRYGDGMLFVRVFDANRDSIVDPHLIYPGQVFALPE